MARVIFALVLACVGTAQQKAPTVPRDIAGHLQGKAELCAGARVTFWVSVTSDFTLDPIADGKTDATGQFFFTGVPWFADPAWKRNSILAVARAGDAAIGLLQIRSDRDDLDRLTIELQPAMELTGSVQSEDGKPIADALVWPWIIGVPPKTLAWITAPLPQWQARSGADGKYRLRCVPAGIRIELRAAHPDFEEQHGQLDAGQSTCDFTLAPGARIEGTVRNPDGSPAVRVFVAAIGNGGARLFRRAQTDDQGRFTIPSLGAAKYNVWAEAKDLTVVAIDSLPVGRGETVRDQDLQLIRGGRIVGRVIDKATGKGVRPGPWSDVAMDGPARPSSNGACECADIADDGTFAIVAPPGRNRIYLCPSPEWAGGRTKWVDVVDGAEATVEFEVRRAGPR